MSNGNLEKMLVEMQSQLQKQEFDLQSTLLGIEKIKKNNQIIELSMKEIKETGKDHVWEAVGKSFVQMNLTDYELKLKNEIKQNIELMNNLNKKKHYLETSLKNTIDSLNKVTGQKSS